MAVQLEDKLDRAAHVMGKRIAWARMECGWTQRDLAVRLNLFQEDIADYEDGRVPYPINLVPGLCRIFDKPLSWWFPGME